MISYGSWCNIEPTSELKYKPDTQVHLMVTKSDFLVSEQATLLLTPYFIHTVLIGLAFSF